MVQLNWGSMRFVILSVLVFFLSNGEFCCASIDSFNKPVSPEEMLKQLESVRLKDIVSFEGIRGNLLMGYGLVVGLDGTGDNVRNVIFTKKELEDFLSRLGINANGAELKTKNVAAVMVTSVLPPFSRSGNSLDVKVSALGDAKSLEGGMLLATPLKGADGEVYAVAQGEVAISGVPPKGLPGFRAHGKGVRTVGYVNNGAIVEREIDFELNSMKTINLSLLNPDLSTANVIAEVINDEIEVGIAKARDPNTVEIIVPLGYRNDVVGLLSTIEQLKVVPDMGAKIIVDENTGTIIIGEKVKVRPIAISHGELSLSIGKNIRGFDINTSLQDLVDALNDLGIPQTHLVDILRTLKSSGALQGELLIK